MSGYLELSFARETLRTFELDLLFSFQRPTRQIPVKVGVRTTEDYPADQGAQSLLKLAPESILFFVNLSSAFQSAAPAEGGGFIRQWNRLPSPMGAFGRDGLRATPRPRRPESSHAICHQHPFKQDKSEGARARTAPRGGAPRRALVCLCGAGLYTVRG